MSVEALPDHLQRVDLREARAVVAVVELGQAHAEVVLALGRVAHAEIGEPARKELDALLRGVDEEARQPRHVGVGERPTAPKSTSPISPSGSTSTFAGCGSPWKKPWRKIIAIHASVIR